MKLKENKGMSLIVFTIILVVLVIVAIGIIVYLLNNPVKEKVAVQNPIEVAQLNSSSEVKEKYTNTLTDAQNGKTAFIELESKGGLQTEKHDGYYTYVDPFENKYNIKEIKDVVSAKGMMGTDNWAALFKVTIIYVDNNNQTKTMILAIVLLPSHEVQNMGTYDNYTGSTSFMRSFSDSYEDNKVITEIEALQIGNELFKKMDNLFEKSHEGLTRDEMNSLYDIVTENVELELSSFNISQKNGKTYFGAEEILTSIFNWDDVGRKELKISSIKQDKVIFDVLFYNIKETDEQIETIDKTIKRSFTIKKINNQWLIDSIEANQ